MFPHKKCSPPAARFRSVGQTNSAGLQKLRTLRTIGYNPDQTTCMDDSEMITAVRAGDKEAFGALVERYQRTLYYFVVGKVADDAEAKDIVQKTFVVAFQQLAEFRPGG